MDSNPWIISPSLFSSSWRRCQSRSDLYLGGGSYDDHEVQDDFKTEFICPFCAEDFDIVGLCVHIDEEHPVESKNEVCPLCTKRVGSDIVSHVTTQHSDFSKVQRMRRLRRGGYSSAYLTLKKELHEANLQSLRGVSSSSTNIDSDPLLSSFMFNSANNKSAITITKETSDKKVSYKESLERDVRETPISGEDQEKAEKSEFVRGLLISTMLEDNF